MKSAGKFTKILSAAVAQIAVFLIILIVLLSSIELAAFDINFYKKEYKKLNSAEFIGVDEEELMYITRELLNYLRHERDNLEIDACISGISRRVFNEREIMHMEDVKNLFSAGYSIRKWCALVLLVLLVLLYSLQRDKFIVYLSRAFLKTVLGLLVLLAALIILMCIDFTKFWDGFHSLFFTNDLWQLDPQTDVLIQMMPESFFVDMVIRIMCFFIGSMAILSILFISIVYMPETQQK